MNDKLAERALIFIERCMSCVDCPIYKKCKQIDTYTCSEVIRDYLESKEGTEYDL